MITLLKAMYHMVEIERENSTAKPDDLASLCEGVVLYASLSRTYLSKDCAGEVRLQLREEVDPLWFSNYYRLKGRVYQCYSLRQGNEPDRFDMIKELTSKFDSVIVKRLLDE